MTTKRHHFPLYSGTSVERASFSLPTEAVGSFFYDTTTESFYYWDGSVWQEIGSGSGSGTPYHNRVLATGETLTVPDGYSMVVARYFELQGTAVLTLEGDAVLEIL